MLINRTSHRLVVGHKMLVLCAIRITVKVALIGVRFFLKFGCVVLLLVGIDAGRRSDSMAANDEDAEKNKPGGKRGGHRCFSQQSETSLDLDERNGIKMPRLSRLRGEKTKGYEPFEKGASYSIRQNI